jgi:hypothetical protein
VTKPLPRPPRHLHIFGISLLLIVGALVAFLFGVKMEATAPATGIVSPDEQFSADDAWPPIRLEFEEKNFGSVEIGQEVRLYSNMYHHRAHGIAKGVIERLEPVGVEGPNGSRRFRAWVKVTESPFPMRLGSSVRAEVVTGTKRTYQIILEH